MAVFDNVINFALGHEVSNGGTLLDNPKTGELSNFGITGPFLQQNNASLFATQPSVRQLTRLQAIQTYQNYFNNLGLPSLKSDRVAAKFFDMCINMGSVEAARLLQMAVNSMGAAVPVDGKFGVLTENAVNMLTTNIIDGEGKLLAVLVQRCITFYKSIATGNKAIYLSAWLSRANDLPKEA